MTAYAERRLGGVAAVETHVSLLFFAGDRVYKVRKPVRFDFLDFSSREAREVDCHRELALNRRYAPDVYLGVYDIVDRGQAVDHAVVMRRLPEDRRLSRRVSEKTATCGDLAAVVGVLQAAEESACRSAEIDVYGTKESLLSAWRANTKELAPFVGTLIDPATDTRACQLAEEYLDGRERLLATRIEKGYVRDGHGDVRAEDIFVLDDGPRILDCIEFDERLRFADVLADIGFLAMDLEHLGAPTLRRALFRIYRELTGDGFPDSLASYYVASRAYMRAKVACLAAAEGLEGSDAQARELHELALAWLERARVRLVLIGGLPGTGKSTLARDFGAASGDVVVSSDEIRHRLDEPAGRAEGLYIPAVTERTYADMLARAHDYLELGQSVILDASWTDERHRAAARAVAEAARSTIVELQCDSPMSVAERRISERLRSGGSDSDATVAVAEAMSARTDPWPEATVIDTSGSLSASVAAVRRALCEAMPDSLS